jgi:hypothetical protein
MSRQTVLAAPCAGWGRCTGSCATKVQQPQTPVTGDFPMPAGWRELVIREETPR